MLIGKKGYYYIKALLFFAFSSKQSLSIKELSDRLKMSNKVMEQVLLSLKNAGFLTSKRGPQGGYRLAADPSELTLWDILEKTDQVADIMPSDAWGKKTAVDDVLHETADDIAEIIRRKLMEIKIRELVDTMCSRVTEEGFDYVI